MASPLTSSLAVEPARSRLYWIDYLRSINILGTVFFHSFLAYSPFVQGIDVSYLVNFPFVDTGTSIQYADLILLLRPMFSMQLMFFISGLFAWRSLQKRGCRGYLVNRFMRLIIPLLVLAVVLMPITYLPGDFTFKQSETHIRLAHLWFLWVLFVFDAALVLMFRIGRKRLERMMASLTNRGFYTLFLLLLIIAYLPLAQVSSQTGGWLTIYGPLMVPLSRMGLYIVYFMVGVVLGSRCLRPEVSVSNLLSPYAPPDRSARTVYLSTLFICILFVVLRLGIDPLISLYGAGLSWLVVNVLYALAGFALVVSLVLFAKRFLQRQNNVMDNLAKDSYGIYLIHYTIVVWLQFALSRILFPGAFKPWLVFLLAIPLSWIAADGLRRLPLVNRLLVSA
jgi:glucan biosynthesis protein C